MILFSMMHLITIVLVALIGVILFSKIFLIMLYKKNAGESISNRLLGWYTNYEIYGSGHSKKAKVLNAANTLTTFFWIMLALLGSVMIFGSKLLG